MASKGRYNQEQLQQFVEEFLQSGLQHVEFVRTKEGLASSTFSVAKARYGKAAKRRLARRAAQAAKQAPNDEQRVFNLEQGPTTAEELSREQLQVEASLLVEARKRLENERVVLNAHARNESSVIEGLRREVRMLRKMLAEQWGVARQG